MLQTLRPIDINSRKTNKQKRMSEVEDIFDGHIRIYKTTNSGDVWQLRMYVQEEKRYIRESLKTRDKSVAISRAQDRFIFYQARLRNGEVIFSITAEEFREKYLTYINSLVEDGQMSKGRASCIRSFTLRYLEFVGKDKKLGSIDKNSFIEYRAFRQKSKKDITMTVVVNELLTIKQMYRWGRSKGLVGQSYEINYGDIKIQKHEVRRQGYSVSEYKQLVSYASKWYTQVPKLYENRDEEIYYRKTVRDFIVLMANYGFRTGELLQLKFKDVKVLDDERATVLVRAETSKVRQSREVTGRRADVFNRRKEYSTHTQDNDFVFSNFKEKKMMTKDRLYKYYNKLIKEVKAKHESFDDEKDLYGLRHLWITIHLLIGKVDVYTIARYAGTSLNQIQKHYDNVKDKQVSEKILSYKLRFDDMGGVILDDIEKANTEKHTL
jgi:integrase